jgi:hypothetical protein
MMEFKRLGFIDYANGLTVHSRLFGRSLARLISIANSSCLRRVSERGVPPPIGTNRFDQLHVLN